MEKDNKDNNSVVSDNNSGSLDDSVVAEENTAEIVKKLRDKLKKCEAERMEYLTGWQRAKADHINARKRDETERGEFVRFANQDLIAELIPVLGSFDMAMANKTEWEKVDSSWRSGIESIYNQLVKVLNNFGVKEVNPINEKFDHNLYEAVLHEPVMDEKLDHMIIGVVQKGYSLNGKVLRAPKVKVGEFKR